MEPLLRDAAAAAGRQLANCSDVHGARLALTTAYDHTCSLSLMPELSRMIRHPGTKVSGTIMQGIACTDAARKYAVTSVGNHWLADTYGLTGRPDVCLTVEDNSLAPEQPVEAGHARDVAQPSTSRSDKLRASSSLPASQSDLPSLLLALSPPRAPWLHDASAVLLASAALPRHGATAACYHVPGDSLTDILQHTNQAILADMDRRVVLLQLSLAVAALHAGGSAHGAVAPRNIHISQGVLVTLRPSLPSPAARAAAACSWAAEAIEWVAAPVPAPISASRCELQSLARLTERWRSRRICTFEYLLHVNAFAGRRWGDLDRLPMMPWVLEFSCDPRPGLLHTCAAL